MNTWTIAYNTVPESPWETGFSAGTVQTAQIPGSGAVTSTAPGAGGLGGLLLNGSITPAMLNEGITVKTLGGTLTTISASAPRHPQHRRHLDRLRHRADLPVERDHVGALQI